jgi:hypothetical protein
VLELDGQPVRCLSPGDELRYLSVHCAADHAVGRLIWLVDIAELVKALPANFDWSVFTRDTIAAGVAMPVAVALAHCQAWLGLQLPASVLERLVEQASARTERVAWTAARADPYGPAGLRAHLTTLHSPVQVAAFWRGILFPGPSRLQSRYATAQRSALSLPALYLRHWRRMLPLLFAVRIP